MLETRYQDPVNLEELRTTNSKLASAAVLRVCALELLAKEYNPTDHTTSETRDKIFGGVLTAIFNKQLELGLPGESPAILCDKDGQVLQLSVAGSTLTEMSGNISCIDVMRRVAAAREKFQFDGLDFSLHIMGSLNRFEGAGAIYNYGPARVVFTPIDSGADLTFALVVREDYWNEALSRRGISASQTTDINEFSFEVGGARICDIRQVQLPEYIRIPLPEVVERYLNELREIRFEFDSSGEISLKDPNLKKLMIRLHEIALENVIDNGGPFAAAIISPQGKLLSIGVNRVVSGHDAIAHGEQKALDEAVLNLRKITNASGVEDPVLNLDGMTLITSSMTCISCAEQALHYKIRCVVFDNDRDAIESNTPFSEGPLASDFFDIHGISVFRLPTEGEGRLAAFRKFQELIAQGEARIYLEDGSR